MFGLGLGLGYEFWFGFEDGFGDLGLGYKFLIWGLDFWLVFGFGWVRVLV